MEINDKKRRIGVDIDDSLFDFITPYCDFNNFNYKTNLKKEDFKTMYYPEIRGGTMEEAVQSVTDFCYSPFFEKMQPFPRAIEIIQELKKKNNLFIVTSRKADLKKITYNQIDKYFPNIFSEVIFSSNHYTKAKNNGKTKAEICENLKISYLIDDSLVYAKECAQKGIEAILFNSPWNQNGVNEIKGITRVKDWIEIGEILLK